MVGYEKYRIANNWGIERGIIPAESHLFNLKAGWDSTDTPENAQACMNPSVDEVTYKHNSLGYRGDELRWNVPNLTFVGDENTKCVGIDDEHMWTRIVARQRGVWENNLGRDNASNEWIGEQSLRVMEFHPATKLVVQWTDPRRFMYVDYKGRYRDFLPDREIVRDSLFVSNKPETARKVFYEIDNPMWGIERMMLQVTLVEEFADAFKIPCLHVFSFINQYALDFVRKHAPRKCVLNSLVHDHNARDGVHCGNAGMRRLADWVIEKQIGTRRMS